MCDFFLFFPQGVYQMATYKSKNAPLDSIIIHCDCGSNEHQYLFGYDAEYGEFFLDTHLVTWHNVFHRIWIAIKYVFGYKSKYGNWDEIIVNQNDATELARFIAKHIPDRTLDIMGLNAKD